MSAEALARIDAALARHESQNAGDPFHFDLTNHLYVALREARALIPAPPTDDEREALASVRYVVRGGGHVPDATHLVGYAVADAILAVGFRRRGPVTNAVVVDALTAFYGGVRDSWSMRKVDRMRAALEGARAVR